MPSPPSRERTNGHAPGVTRLAAVLQRVTRIPLDPLGYAGQWVDLITSCTRRDRETWFGPNGPPTGEVLAQLVAGWSLADATGTPLPVTAATFVDVLPEDIVSWLIQSFVYELSGPLERATAARQSSAASPSSVPPGSASSDSAAASAMPDPGS